VSSGERKRKKLCKYLKRSFYCKKTLEGKSPVANKYLHFK